VEKITKSLPTLSIEPPKAQENKNAPAQKTSKKTVSTIYQVRLSPEWNSNGFRFLSLNGSRYSRKIVLKQAKSGGSQFLLKKDGALIINLMNDFDIELAFYPPTNKGHEQFKPFTLEVYNDKRKVISQQNVSSRMKVYRINQKQNK